MKKISILLLSLTLSILFVSCKKESEPTPDPDYTKELTGKYQVTLYREGPLSIDLPSNGISGEIDVQKRDMTHIDVLVVMKAEDEEMESDKLTFELKPLSGKTFELYDSNKKYGTISPTEITITETAPDGTVGEVRGKR